MSKVSCVSSGKAPQAPLRMARAELLQSDSNRYTIYCNFEKTVYNVTNYSALQRFRGQTKKMSAGMIGAGSLQRKVQRLECKKW